MTVEEKQKEGKKKEYDQNSWRKDNPLPENFHTSGGYGRLKNTDQLFVLNQFFISKQWGKNWRNYLSWFVTECLHKV